MTLERQTFFDFDQQGTYLCLWIWSTGSIRFRINI